jgi:hypothetical protein
MKKVLLAAIAALTLSLSVGSAFAAQTASQNGFSARPAYSDDALGGA